MHEECICNESKMTVVLIKVHEKKLRIQLSEMLNFKFKQATRNLKLFLSYYLNEFLLELFYNL
jgi:hypothetical protein